MTLNINYQVDLFALFMLMGVGQGLFLSFVFLFIRNSKPTLYLGLLMFALTLLVLESFLNYSQYTFIVIYLFSYANSLAFVAGPLFFLYLYTQLYGKPRWAWVHFIPFGLYFIYYLFYFNLQSNDLKLISYISSHSIDYNEWPNDLSYKFKAIRSIKLQHYYSPIVILHYGSYLFVSFVLYIQYLKKNKLPFLFTANGQLRWIRNLLFSFILIFLLAAFNGLVIKLSTHNYILGTVLSAWLYFVNFSYISKSSFFSSREITIKKYLKYNKSTLTDENKKEILQKIIHQMETEKLYADNLFSLNMLAKKVGSSTNYVSQVINECCQKTFYDFVADYRIDAAKKLLSSANAEEKISIESIAFEVGYNSKSAFNTTFKKRTGKTPTDYRSVH